MLLIVNDKILSFIFRHECKILRKRKRWKIHQISLFHRENVIFSNKTTQIPEFLTNMEGIPPLTFVTLCLLRIILTTLWSRGIISGRRQASVIWNSFVAYTHYTVILLSKRP